jgi:hypothetical protein
MSEADIAAGRERDREGGPGAGWDPPWWSMPERQPLDLAEPVDEQSATPVRTSASGVEGDPFGGPVAMRLGGGGSWSTVERTRLG